MRICPDSFIFFREFTGILEDACVKKFSKWLFLAAALCSVVGMRSVSAQSSANKKLRFDFHIANSYQNFDGVTGADFSSINRLNYSVGAFYRFKKYFDAGAQFSITPSIALSPLVFSDNIVGAYDLKFLQYEMLLGIVRQKIRFHILSGFEQLSMSGAPVLTRGLDLKFYYGGQLSVDFWKRRAVRIPVFLRVLKKGRRLYEFDNKPDDPIDVKAGMEYVIGTGADFEFK